MRGVALVAIIAAFIAAVCVLAIPSPAAQRGYTFANVDSMAVRFLPVLKARMGCPDSWTFDDGLEDCRPAAAHKDLDSYDKARKAARRLWP